MRIKSICSAVLVTACTFAVALSVTVPVAPRAMAADEAAKDIVVLNSGRLIEGRILEETATTVRMMVVVAGIEAPVTYQKSEILEIQRGAGGAMTNADEDAPASPERERRSDSDAPVVYLLELDGRFIGNSGISSYPQRNVLSRTPMTRALDDARKHDPDVLIVRLEADSAPGAAGVFVAEDIGPLFEELIYDEGRRVVFWIDTAFGGAALLPFVSPEIYFTTEGLMGGLAGIGETDSGDVMVDEKLIGAYLGHAEGFAIKGGYQHGPALIRAMSRSEQWLAVRWRGGEPEFIDWEPRPDIDGEDWTILTDDGEGDNEDVKEFGFVAPGRGDDVLNLTPDMAERLRVSKGAFDRVDDLVFALNIGRDYELIDDRGARYVEDWNDRLVQAVDEFLQLQEDIAQEREPARLMSLLRRQRGLVASYAEALDPSGQMRAQLDVQIEQAREAMRRASERERRSNRNRR